jgi:hypothetical protein
LNTESADRFSKYGSYKDNVEFERALIADSDTLVYVMFLTYYPDLVDQELRVCRIIVETMWDLHMNDLALYEEVVHRVIPEYFICKEDLPSETPRELCLFDDLEDVHEVIRSLVEKGVFHDIETEFLYGPEDKQTARMERVLTFTRKELNDEINSMRLKLGVYY